MIFAGSLPSVSFSYSLSLEGPRFSYWFWVGGKGYGYARGYAGWDADKIVPHAGTMLAPVVGIIPAVNLLIAGLSSGTVAAGCTAMVGRFAVGAEAAIVARPFAFKERLTFARNARICFFICCHRSSSCSCLNSARDSFSNAVVTLHGCGG
jgi:hypothetical protein